LAILTTGVPHSSVDSSLFYTHISPLDPEPLRAKHLLLFCVDRAAKKELAPTPNSKTKTRKTDTARTEEGDRLLSDIIADFSRGLGLGEIALDFYSSGVCPYLQKGGGELISSPARRVYRKDHILKM
jgi:kinetochore protein Mis13/DSN1